MVYQNILKTLAIVSVLAGPVMSTSQVVSAETLDGIQVEKSDTQLTLDRLSTQLETSVDAVAQLNDELDDLETDIATIEQIIEQHKADMTKQETIVQERFEQAQLRLQSMQLTNINQNVVLALLEAGSFQELLQRVNAVVHLSQVNQDQLQAAQQAQDKLNTIVNQLETKQAEHSQVKQSVTDKKQVLDDKLGSLTTLINENKEALDVLKSREAAEVERIKQAERLAAEHRATEEKEQQMGEAPPETAQAAPLNDQTPEAPVEQTSSPAAQSRSAEPAPVASSGGSTARYSIEDLEFQGVIHALGKKWTFYSERVLPGNGLAIPGRHTAGGFVRDGEGYIVLAASSSVGRGTIIDTPFGSPGKVYDTCASCHATWVDVYTR